MGSMSLLIRRIIYAFSVRARIIVLALIPVVGFLATVITYTSSEREIGTAFQTVKQYRRARRCQPRFQKRFATMRLATKDFIAAPSQTFVKAYEEGQNSALLNLDLLQAALDPTRVEPRTATARGAEVEG